MTTYWWTRVNLSCLRRISLPFFFFPWILVDPTIQTSLGGSFGFFCTVFPDHDRSEQKHEKWRFAGRCLDQELVRKLCTDLHKSVNSFRQTLMRSDLLIQRVNVRQKHQSGSVRQIWQVVQQPLSRSTEADWGRKGNVTWRPLATSNFNLQVLDQESRFDIVTFRKNGSLMIQI